ncbi:MAG: DUF952 domain-containing protein [Hyphomicrobiales bacterium]|nr:MAG: DUF952 domain-containing protein [Hyphomicrobiales bacterium]
MTNPDFIYKIASAENFAAAIAASTYRGMPIDEKDGYVHFSTAAQLAETLSLHFKGQSGLVLFSVRSADLGSKLVWEPSRGGQLFPHVYGTFPMSALAWQGMVDVGADGSVTLPAEVV